MSKQRCECMYVRCTDGTRELYLQCDECAEKQREKKLKSVAKWFAAVQADSERRARAKKAAE